MEKFTIVLDSLSYCGGELWIIDVSDGRLLERWRRHGDPHELRERLQS